MCALYIYIMCHEYNYILLAERPGVAREIKKIEQMLNNNKIINDFFWLKHDPRPPVNVQKNVQLPNAQLVQLFYYIELFYY